MPSEQDYGLSDHEQPVGPPEPDVTAIDKILKEREQDCLRRIHQEIAEEVKKWKLNVPHAEPSLAEAIRDITITLAQVLQERDALRLRIKAVDEEHEQIKKERERMIQAYTAVEQDRDFWKGQHEGLMDTLRQVQTQLDHELAAAKEYATKYFEAMKLLSAREK